MSGFLGHSVVDTAVVTYDTIR